MAGVLKIIEEYYLKNPDKLAVISNNEELTYKDLYFGSISFANYLNKLNIKEKSKVVIRANNDIDFWCVFFGSMLKRITLIIIDDSLPTSSLKDIYDSYDNISLLR